MTQPSSTLSYAALEKQRDELLRVCRMARKELSEAGMNFQASAGYPNESGRAAKLRERIMEIHRDMDVVIDNVERDQ